VPVGDEHRVLHGAERTAVPEAGRDISLGDGSAHAENVRSGRPDQGSRRRRCGTLSERRDRH
jgi:hypothetical protein